MLRTPLSKLMGCLEVAIENSFSGCMCRSLIGEWAASLAGQLTSNRLSGTLLLQVKLGRQDTVTSKHTGGSVPQLSSKSHTEGGVVARNVCPPTSLLDWGAGVRSRAPFFGVAA